jgi:hypothetical protein
VKRTRDRTGKAKAIAALWGVTTRMVGTWRSRGFPVGDEKALAEVLLSSPMPCAKVRERALEILGPSSETALELNGENGSEAELDGKQLGWLQSYWKVSRGKLQTALDGGVDEAGINRWHKRTLEVAQTIMRIQLAEKRLGIESGALVAREEVERCFEAVGYHQALACARLGDQLGSLCVGLASPQEIARRATSELLTKALVDPLGRAVALAAATGLPAWVVEAIKRGLTTIEKDT